MLVCWRTYLLNKLIMKSPTYSWGSCVYNRPLAIHWLVVKRHIGPMMWCHTLPWWWHQSWHDRIRALCGQTKFSWNKLRPQWSSNCTQLIGYNFHSINPTKGKCEEKGGQQFSDVGHHDFARNTRNPVSPCVIRLSMELLVLEWSHDRWRQWVTALPSLPPSLYFPILR